MQIKIALAGNPNTGKTTLFNALTGSNQFVGNWPGVTVEKKEGKLKGHKNVVITDLPGIYSLSPYTLEEVVARNYLINETPDAILNIIDGTNLERNLYLSTQLSELGIPMVAVINMADILQKNGEKLDLNQLSKSMGCPVFEISALKGTGIAEAAEKAVEVATNKNPMIPQHSFSGSVEHALAHIEEAVLHDLPEHQQRWYAVKLFERDDKVREALKLTKEQIEHIEADIVACEEELDDTSESIITLERYGYISSIIQGCYIKRSKNKLSASDKIDKVITNRVLGLPIFLAIMFIVYFVSVTTVGTWVTDWTNDGLFGDGFHLFGVGAKEYEVAAEEFGGASEVVNGFISFAVENGIDTGALETALDTEAEDFDADAAAAALSVFAAAFSDNDEITYLVEDEETLAAEEISATGADLSEAVVIYNKYAYMEPDPADYGIWVSGIPVAVENALASVNCADWLKSVILDGIIAGVGAVLGFVPQILVLFIFLAFLESCGYMARVAFVLDRIFRKFGLSGKSFIPILIGTGCGIPGVMASRTIENEKDRRMTIMTTTFIPCGAKVPFIAMVAGAIFGGAPWVAPLAYFIGIVAIICSGIILKKMKMFAGETAPFVMELPAYHLPTIGTVLRSMWERGWSFIKKAGTIILLSTIVIWFLSGFGVVDGQFTMLSEEEVDLSILAAVGNAIAWLFMPLGWGTWQAAVASITGLVAKENIVGTMGILYSAGAGTVYQNIAAVFTAASGMAFLVFNLLCAPCFAAIGAIKREMNSAKWTWFAIGYQTIFAYVVALCVYQFGSLFMGSGFTLWTAIAIVLAILLVYLLLRPMKKKEITKKAVTTTV